jgi:hypothetical protein
VSIFGAAGGGFLALSTYGEEVAKMEDGRVVQTFALFEMFNSSERLQARQRVFDHMRNDTPLDSNDIYIFVDFYDALQVCVDRNLCDKDLAVRLFQSYAVPVWDGLGETLIGARTESDPHFAGGLEWMASLPLPEPSPSSPTARRRRWKPRQRPRPPTRRKPSSLKFRRYDRERPRRGAPPQPFSLLKRFWGGQATICAAWLSVGAAITA